VKPRRQIGRRRRLPAFTVRTLAANVITTLALSAGMTAIRFAIEGRYELAVVFVLAAAVLDGLDGAVARLLKSTSRFGAELDSLSDVIAFGIAPAFLLYNWGLASMERMGWIVALAFGVACALRLARYNARMEDDDDPRRPLGFFTGVPAPAAAGLALLPMVLDFAFGAEVFRDSVALIIYVAGVAAMMVSTLPSYSLRQVRIKPELLVPTLFLIALFTAAVTVYRWAAVAVVALAYLASLPLASMSYRRMRARGESSVPEADEKDVANEVDLADAEGAAAEDDDMR